MQVKKIIIKFILEQEKLYQTIIYKSNKRN